MFDLKVVWRIFLPFIALILAYASAVNAQQVSGTQSATEAFNVRVEDGDNLITIVDRVLGSREAWPLVAQFNNLVDPDVLKPGQLIAIPSYLLSEREHATLAYVKGDVQYIPAGQEAPRQAERNQKMYAGDSVRTGDTGFVSLSFSGNSIVNVQPLSHIRIDKIRCVDLAESCEINLWTDEGDANLRIGSDSFATPVRFTIETPYASAAVRGTVFDFTASPAANGAGNTLGVTEGEVVISLQGEQSSVPVGKGVVAGEGNSINQQYDLLVAPIVDNVSQYFRISSEDRLSWLAVDGAAQYEVAFGKTPEVGEILGKTRLVDNFSGIDLPAGEYYAGVRGIDENGLRGFTAVQQLVAVDIDEQQSVELGMELLGDILRVEIPAASNDEQFEVQVGDTIETIGDSTALLNYRGYDLSEGRRYYIPVDITRDVYVRYRQIYSDTTVSRYSELDLIATGRTR